MRKTPSAASRPRNPRMRAAERRASIEAAARRVFVRRGLEGARTREIAQEAGIAEAVLYRHFESKEVLFEATILDPLERMVERVAEIAGRLGGLSPNERFRENVEAHRLILEAIIESGPLLSVALSSERDGATEFFRTKITPVLQRVDDAVAKNIEAFELDIEPRVLSGMMLGTYNWLAMRSEFEGAEVDVDRTAAQVLGVLLWGVGGRRSNTSSRHRRK